MLNYYSNLLSQGSMRECGYLEERARCLLILARRYCDSEGLKEKYTTWGYGSKGVKSVTALG